MAERIEANRGDVAEGVMGAALTAKFIKRQLGQTVENLPQVNTADVDAVLSKFFRSNTGRYTKTVRDVPKPLDYIPQGAPGNEVETTVNIVRELMFSDKVIFKLTLPQKAMEFLSKQSNRTRVRDIYERAVKYANSDSIFIREANRLATNAKNDKIIVDADGVSNQLETKVDIGLFANGRKIGKQISLKTESGKQFHQIVGFGIAEFDSLFVDRLGISIDGNYRRSTIDYIRSFNIDDAYAFRGSTSKDATKSPWAMKLKKAATIYYKGAERSMKTKVNEIDFKRKLAATIRYGATRNEDDIQLIQFVGAKRGYDQRLFESDFEDKIENADLSIASVFDDNPTIKIVRGKKTVVQFRARIDAGKLEDGYKIKLRQLLESGPGLFLL